MTMLGRNLTIYPGGVVDLWEYAMEPHLLADPYHLPVDFIGPALIDGFVDANCFDAPSLDPENMAEMRYGSIIDLGDPVAVSDEIVCARDLGVTIDRFVHSWSTGRSWSADYGREEEGGHVYVFPAESSEGMEITIDSASAELTHENVMNLLNAIFGVNEDADLSTPGDSDYQLDMCWRCEEVAVEPEDEVGLCALCASELKDLVDG